MTSRCFPTTDRNSSVPLMSKFPVRRFLLLLVTLGCLALPAGAHAFSIGMSDQKLGMWQDPRFAELGIQQVRLLVSYDSVLKHDFSRYDQWMEAAHARGADVLLTIDRSAGSYTAAAVALPVPARRPHPARALPVGRDLRGLERGQPRQAADRRKPRRAAQYYNILREECAGCTLIAADVLDSKNIFSWLATFKRYAKHPRIWGLHSYQDANHFRPLRATVTRSLLRAVKGEIWLTETGGIVRFGDNYKGGKTFEKRAAKAMKYTFRIASMSPRIKRVYLYHWDTDKKFVTWDSAFVDERTGRARPSLEVLRDELNRQRRKSQAAARPEPPEVPGQEAPARARPGRDEPASRRRGGPSPARTPAGRPRRTPRRSSSGVE